MPTPPSKSHARANRATVTRHIVRSWRLMVALIFLTGVIVLTLTHQMHVLVPAMYLIASITSFIVYAIDKSKARQSKWRTPEATLLTIDLLCGWPGGLLAQSILHHKNQKTSYQLKFLLVTLANLLVVTAIHWPDFYRSLFS